MSVWVEILENMTEQQLKIVTLHMSVWVEMSKWCKEDFDTSSRSTWACELKFLTMPKKTTIRKSRSTWACELKSFCSVKLESLSGHAPHERVSWNVERWWYHEQSKSHAPHERVSWNCCQQEMQFQLPRHAPHERVSWNLSFIIIVHFVPVTLHVSVWVEILCGTWGTVWDKRSRSTWACESIFVSTQDLGCTLSAQITASAVWCSKLAVKDVYPEFNWRKGGYVHGRRKWYSHEVKKRRKSWVSCLP